MLRIGVIVPSFAFSDQEERQKMLPPGVSLHTTRVRVRGGTYEALLHMADNVEEAASLLSDAAVNMIAFACTAGSLIKGKGYDQEIIQRITRATGLPATTTATAVLAALNKLGITRLAMLTPYVDRLNETEKAVLEDCGIRVLGCRGLGLDRAPDQYQVLPSRWHDLLLEMKDALADGYLISCGGIRVVDAIERTEKDMGKPVVTSNQALIWHCLRMMGIQERIEGFGRLLRI